jgi:hypothetical protein
MQQMEKRHVLVQYRHPFENTSGMLAQGSRSGRLLDLDRVGIFVSIMALDVANAK